MTPWWITCRVDTCWFFFLSTKKICNTATGDFQCYIQCKESEIVFQKRNGRNFGKKVICHTTRQFSKGIISWILYIYEFFPYRTVTTVIHLSTFFTVSVLNIKQVIHSLWVCCISNRCFILCKLWAFHSGVAEDSGLLGSDNMSQTFMMLWQHYISSKSWAALT